MSVPGRDGRLGVALASVAILVGAGLLGAVAGHAASQPGAVEQPAADNTVTRIEVRADGSARWTVRIRTRLATAESVAAYERFQAAFRANRSRYLAGFREPIRRIVAAASNETGRPMAARNFSAETSIRTVPRRWGVVTYGFTWDGFARTDGDRLRVGDAFESGFFLARNDTLLVSAPDGYEVAAARPPPEAVANGTARWVGRVDFGEGQPGATLAPVPDETGGDGAAGVPLGPVIALLVLVLGVAGGLYARRRPWRERALPGRDGGDGREAGAETGGELVTDEERVRRVLRDHGGRMRQADVVDELEWSKSKVSRLLSALAEEGAVEKTRLGRENVVELVEDEPPDEADRSGE